MCLSGRKDGEFGVENGYESSIFNEIPFYLKKRIVGNTDEKGGTSFPFK